MCSASSALTAFHSFSHLRYVLAAGGHLSVLELLLETTVISTSTSTRTKSSSSTSSSGRISRPQPTVLLNRSVCHIDYNAQIVAHDADLALEARAAPSASSPPSPSPRGARVTCLNRSISSTSSEGSSSSRVEQYWARRVLVTVSAGVLRHGLLHADDYPHTPPTPAAAHPAALAAVSSNPPVRSSRVDPHRPHSAHALTFSPPLPPYLARAIQDIGMGARARARRVSF